MLGPEKEIIEAYVKTGQVKLVFWPMLDHGQASLDASTAVHCAGQQNPQAYWLLHDQLFEENYSRLVRSNRSDYINAALQTGLVEVNAFSQCFDSEEARQFIQDLDQQRREDDVFVRPTFDLNGERFNGVPPFAEFQARIEAALAP